MNEDRKRKRQIILIIAITVILFLAFAMIGRSLYTTLIIEQGL